MLFSGTTICCEKWIVDRRRQSTVRRVLGGMDTSQPFVHIVTYFVAMCMFWRVLGYNPTKVGRYTLE